nr:adenine phosphoribosyltransferase [Corynebacterium cyclohexanicum]
MSEPTPETTAPTSTPSSATTPSLQAVEDILDRLCATVPDYPKPGIVFKDLTPAFADAEGLRAIVDAIVAPFAGEFDLVAGIEARGFLLASAAAYATGTGVLTVRKAGKLPRETFTEEYALEYGTAALEVHTTDIPDGARVLVLDDVLATGGTVGAAVRLVNRCGGTVVGVGVVLELEALGGRGALVGQRVHSLQRLGD